MLQALLAALAEVARKHGVSSPMSRRAGCSSSRRCAPIIVGARLGEREHRADNLRLFSFALDADDHARIERALADARPIPGDCGDEYRRPPFLTASGDLRHHLESFAKVWPSARRARPARPLRVDSGSGGSDLPATAARSASATASW